MAWELSMRARSDGDERRRAPILPDAGAAARVGPAQRPLIVEHFDRRLVPAMSTRPATAWAWGVFVINVLIGCDRPLP
jgi:hypothetical protein